MKTETLAGGLCFGEGPRWRDNRLYFSDMHAGRVHALDLEGNLETIVSLDGDEPPGSAGCPMVVC